ncbi:hypothetical protein GNI_145140 [Gregarina niphandrodes]|uniref:Uncharacterized protein n=1 Tax=Gregarina niphandrodes TaxID=110365 RepID=A0A023AZY2_GRENI|nr:hypothetical protein GNI_145140 [Gregarina niphandrodes]EZG44625.1 hypothetical protein GNI_145140 [Gregarina niphandrodes]|eukprot:XP_011134144.1 hypothetical protein GNI_145140 [Gregarina niphandrodes]
MLGCQLGRGRCPVRAWALCAVQKVLCPAGWATWSPERGVRLVRLRAVRAARARAEQWYVNTVQSSVGALRVAGVPTQVSPLELHKAVVGFRAPRAGLPSSNPGYASLLFEQLGRNAHKRCIWYSRLNAELWRHDEVLEGTFTPHFGANDLLIAIAAEELPDDPPESLTELDLHLEHGRPHWCDRDALYNAPWNGVTGNRVTGNGVTGNGVTGNGVTGNGDQLQNPSPTFLDVITDDRWQPMPVSCVRWLTPPDPRASAS